jgi:hypothetical protein
MWRLMAGVSMVIAFVGVAGARDVSPLAKRLKMPEIEVAWQRVQAAQVSIAADRRGPRPVEPATFELIRYFQDIESAKDLDEPMRARASETLKLLRALERQARLSDDPGIRRVVRAVQRSCDSCHEASGLKKG